MRRILLLICAFSFVCVPLATVAAEPEAVKKEAAASAKPEPKPAPDAKAKKSDAAPAQASPEKKADAVPVAPEKKATPETAPAASEKKPEAAQAAADKKVEKKADKKTADAKKKKPREAKTVAKTQKTEKSEEKSVKKPVVVLLTLKGEYPEGAGSPGLFGELQPSLAALVQRIDAAAADKDVAAVWLKIEDLAIGRGKIYELRAAIARVRKAKKPVYAELTTADASAYLIAGSCDQIVMPPSGMLIIPGVRAEVTFFKGLLDKLGLKFEALQMGKYKGAAEPLTRSAMSEPLRESLTALLDDMYDDLVLTLAADRKMQDYKVKTLLDQGLFTAAAAKKAGLIDDVLYADQLQDAIEKFLKADEVEVVASYRKKRIDADFSGISGMMKLFGMFLGDKPSQAPGQKQKIAVVYAVGPIMEGKSRSDMFGDSSYVGSTTIVAALRKAADDDKVAAVVLRVDSPGGSATASDLIWRETVRIKKPVVASMGDVAGSGGYYIAMGAKKIIAAPGTLTGSIGVIGGKLVTGGLYGKLGITTEVISRGANSGAISSTQPFTPEERKAWTELLEETYRQFVGKAAEGRKMPFEKLDELAQGRVYTGRMAQKLGLVDSLGTLEDAIAAAKTAAGLKADAEVDLMVLPEPRSMFEQLFGDPAATTDLESLLPVDLGILRQARLMRQLLAEPMLLWMPYGVEVK